jgi:flavodoxin long chain
MKAGIFYGSSFGDTASAAEFLAAFLNRKTGLDFPVFNVGSEGPLGLADFDLLLLGSSTWDGTWLQPDWHERLPELEGPGAQDLAGRRFALFGAGDQLSYGETFLDALGILAELLERRGAALAGRWPVEGYEHVASRAQRGDHFVGLALDYDNQIDLSDERLERWALALIGELGLRNGL